MAHRGLALALLVPFALGPLPVVADEPLFNADGYRVARYRAPTPAALDGVATLNPEQARRHHRADDAIFVDVLAAPYRQPADGLPGAWLIATPRYNIPGSLWLPNVGHGELSAERARYLRVHLDRAVRARPDAVLIFYCIADCWMSWNAARRAAALGYPRVAWFPAGSDGWRALGLPETVAEPLPPIADPID